MAQYLFAVCHDEDYSDNDYDSPEFQRIAAKVTAFNEKAIANGTMVFGGGLKPTSSSTVVRSTAGSVSMTDGPYAETKEQMGGFWVLELADLDTALDLAGAASDACERPIEVRPFEGTVPVDELSEG